jgi:hypothetical protein
MNGSLPVITGLDPVIHLLRKISRRSMDTRVKPAYDDAPSPLVASAQIMTNKLLPAFPNPASMRRE